MKLLKSVGKTIKRSNPNRGFSTASILKRNKSLEDHLQELNEEVKPIVEEPIEMLKWSMNKFNGNLAMGTSFGIQSAILLHLATSIKPDIPVIWVDTGYLPKETYEYAEALKDALDLNLIVKTNNEWTPARMESNYGKLWETNHKLYGQMRKVTPFLSGLEGLERSPTILLSGLRASQTKARATMLPVGYQHNRLKLLPLLKMTDLQVEEYFDKYDLPKHPLESKGYVTVGDWHSSRPMAEGENARDTRFNGKFQECGLHVNEGEASIELVDFDEVQDQNTIESYKSTKIEALKNVKSHKDTEMAVILVKKIMEDGSFCRKCNDVQAKMESDNVLNWIGDTLYADLRDKTTDGITLAKYFEITTAPFFLVRTKEEEENNEEWKVVKAYLPLKKTLQKRYEAKKQ